MADIPYLWDDTELWDDSVLWVDSYIDPAVPIPEVICDPQPFTVEFAELAIELIDEFCPKTNVVWQSVGEGNYDEERPWEQNQGFVTEFDVRIIFIPHGMETLKYMSNMETLEGHVVGYMYPTDDFIPSPKDTVVFQGNQLNVQKIVEYRPLDCVVLYELDLLI